MSGDRCTAFQGTTRIASGPLAEVAAKVKRIVDTGELSTILIFDDVTAEPVEVDFRGSVEDVIARLTKRSESILAAPSVQRGPGRPRLGVVAREVTLLPRHWEWLARQPGGAAGAPEDPHDRDDQRRGDRKASLHDDPTCNSNARRRTENRTGSRAKGAGDAA